ncbi:MAG: anti-sigma F factor [Clostridia bacterium]|nr:anti-sigma F factor [Clostridia bacterium]
MKTVNKFTMSFPSKSSNEAFARAAVASFVLQLDPTLDELSDIKTAVSEAVTNCIVHGYRDTIGKVYITAEIRDDHSLLVKVRDTGVGIENVELAMQPLYTTGGEERAGLGFAVMQSFMDSLKVKSTVGKGTTITMQKRISVRVGKNAVI